MKVHFPARPSRQTVRALLAASVTLVTGASLVACSASGSADAGSSSSASSKSVAVNADARSMLSGAARSKGTLTFASDFQYPPYDYLDDGQRTGFDYDLGNAIAASLGLKSKWVTQGDFGSLVPAVQNGRVDAAMESINITDERLSAVDFVAYTRSYDALLVPADNPAKLKPSNICGAQLAQGTGGANEPLLKEYSDACVAAGRKPITLNTFSSTDAAMLSVQNHQNEAASVGIAAANSYATRSNGALKVLGGVRVIGTGKLMRSLESGVVVGKGDTKLGQAITEAVKGLQSDGTYAELADKYGLPSNVEVPARYVQQ